MADNVEEKKSVKAVACEVYSRIVGYLRPVQDWNKGKQHQDAVRRLRTQLADVCARLPAGDPARGACNGLWPPSKAAAA